MNAKERESERKAKLAATVLEQRVLNGVSHRDRLAVLTSGEGAFAGHVSDLLMHRADPLLLRVRDEPVLHAAMPHASLPAMLDAADMFQRAEKLCSKVRELPDAEMWSREHWSGAMTCSPLAKDMCASAVQLYKRAVELKYLPAYAPLAWMMSHAAPQQSLNLCDECIAACDARIGVPFAREAKTDCTALRAFVQYEQYKLMQREIEDETPGGRYVEVPVVEAPSIEALEQIEKESTKHGSKYGHALRWLRLSYADVWDARAVQEAAEQAEKGLDLQRCRFCFM